jgi:hypothetical protein
MIAYRILHKPTGLFYCPSREIKVKIQDSNGKIIERHVKSNLSKTGKAYVKRPTIKHIGSSIYTHLITHESQLRSRNTCLIPVATEHWEIVEV